MEDKECPMLEVASCWNVILPWRSPKMANFFVMFEEDAEKNMKNINNRTARKSAQHFHQFSCSLWFSSCWKLGICHMFISWWCLLALHFHWDLWKFLVLLQWELKNACWTPSTKRYVFWDSFAFRHSASDSFPSLQLADRLCSDITHISISMHASPLPSLDICHDHWNVA